MPITLFEARPVATGSANADVHVQRDKVGDPVLSSSFTLNLVLGRINPKPQFDFGVFIRFEVEVPAAAVIHSAKILMYSTGAGSTPGGDSGTFEISGGFLNPQSNARAWEDANGVRNWLVDTDVPFAEWNDGASTDPGVFQDGAAAFTTDVGNEDTNLAEWSIGDGQSPTWLVTGLATQLRDYLDDNVSLLDHTLADHIPVMVHLYRSDSRAFETSYQGVYSAEALFGFGPKLVVEWQVGDAPVVELTSPLNGATFVEGTPILFEGTAEDTEDGNLDATLDWDSLTDGRFQNNSASFSYSGLSLGVHLIACSTVDSDGNFSNDFIVITIVPDLGNIYDVIAKPQQADIIAKPQQADVAMKSQQADITSKPQQADITSKPQQADVTAKPQQADIVAGAEDGNN